MRVLKLTKKTESKVELASLMLNIYCKLADIRVTETELIVMGYFMVYGISKQTKELIVRSEILKSRGSVENMMTALRGKKLLVKVEDEGTKLIPSLNFPIENGMGLIIKLENL